MRDITITELMERIKNEVAAKRLDGSYPPGLEAQLEAEFDSIMAQTSQKRQSRLQDFVNRIEVLRSKAKAVTDRTDTQSRLPGGTLFHKSCELLTRRQFRGLSNQIRDLNLETIQIIEDLCIQVESSTNFENDLARELSMIVLDKIAIVDHLVFSLENMNQRLIDLEVQIQNKS